MAEAYAFWSYVHRDNDAENQRITTLADDVVSAYETLTGESMRIFVDRNNLGWGDEWQSVIDQSLATVSFFIPVLTPRYFQSEDCLRELSTFAPRATQLGVRELVMPILYVRFPGLDESPSSDSVVELAKSFQWEDWTDLRFEERHSSAYRRAVAGMAERLRAATAAIEQVDPVSALADADDDTKDDDSPGFLDRVASAEVALAEWAMSLAEVTDEIEAIGRITESRAAEAAAADSRGKGASGRLIALRALAQDLETPVDQLQAQADAITRQIGDVDSGVRATFEKAQEEVLAGEATSSTFDTFDEFRETLQEFSETARTNLGQLSGLIDNIEKLEKQSRNVRPVLRKMRNSLTHLLSGVDIISDWVRIADEFATRNAERQQHFIPD